jgi:hemoglobin-like flavoprotein
MTPDQKILVQDSFKTVLTIKDQAAALFYERLFTMDPSLRALFKGDMARQGQLLMTMIATAVDHLDHLDQIVPAVKDLGRRHVGYGVREEHYGTVGAALIWTLGQGLGPAFTDEVKAAWIACYGILAGVMQEAAADVAA